MKALATGLAIAFCVTAIAQGVWVLIDVYEELFGPCSTKMKEDQ